MLRLAAAFLVVTISAELLGRLALAGGGAIFARLVAFLSLVLFFILLVFGLPAVRSHVG
jgi:uncharacterized membrane protein YtjA (UPF0391 family)